MSNGLGSGAVCAGAGVLTGAGAGLTGAGATVGIWTGAGAREGKIGTGAVGGGIVFPEKNSSLVSGRTKAFCSGSQL